MHPRMGWFPRGPSASGRARDPSWWSSLVLIAAWLPIGCSDTRPLNALLAAEQAPALHGEITGEVVFRGMCDASGAVALSSRLLIVADDEDNVLRVYDAEHGGLPLSATDVSPELGLPVKGKKEPHWPEMDLEAASVLGDHAYWLASHGRNKKGKQKTGRVMFFATNVPGEGEELHVFGQGYDRLLEDLLEDPRFAEFELAAAAERAPKDPDGLNIEGMTASTENDLWIAFRNPVPRGRALVFPLLNPEELVAEGSSASARFGDPVLLDLGGQGIRALSWWRGRYLVVAGQTGEGGASHLFTWDGAGTPELVEVDLSAYNPEAFFSPEERDRILMLSDDGGVSIGGTPCKDVEDVNERRFRAVWVALEAK